MPRPEFDNRISSSPSTCRPASGRPDSIHSIATSRLCWMIFTHLKGEAFRMHLSKWDFAPTSGELSVSDPVFSSVLEVVADLSLIQPKLE
jgi:hypothetical protein